MCRLGKIIDGEVGKDLTDYLFLSDRDKEIQSKEMIKWLIASKKESGSWN